MAKRPAPLPYRPVNRTFIGLDALRSWQVNQNERVLILGFAGIGVFAMMCSIVIAGVLVAANTGVISLGDDDGTAMVEAPVSLTAPAETDTSQARALVRDRIRQAAGEAQESRRSLPLPAPQLDLATGLTALYEQVNPGVVSIVVTKQGPLSLQGQLIPQQGSGSGFIYDRRHIVTNNHVVEDADDVEVVFFDGERREGSVVGTDVYSDLAVVRVDDLPDTARVLPLIGDFDSLKVGQPVVAIGNPFEKANSMSFGIISALGRTIPDGQTSFAIPQSIQTDAAINPGNSGGPLLNLRGQVVGVNAQINTTNIQPGGLPGNSGVGFAIPSSIVVRVVPELIEDGDRDWSYLGVSGGPISTDLAEANDLATTMGAYIHCVPADGPSAGSLQGADNLDCRTGATTGGDEPVGGDVVIAIDGEPVRSFDDLLAYIALETEPGQAVSLTVLRDGREELIEVQLGDRDELTGR